jgi:linoleoyl-CoA desaturase
MSVAGIKVKFAKDSGFREELERRVDAYFERTGLRRQDDPRMYLKTVVVLSWTVGSYCLLLLSRAWWEAAWAAVSLGVAAAAVGFNVQHDGNHGGYSGSKRVNGLMAFTLDLLGGSSYNWSWKHNVFHHTYPNVTGADEDIDAGWLARLSPHQQRLPGHRFQQFYMWPLYGFLSFKWQFFDDYKVYVSGRLFGHPVPRPRGWASVGLFGGKLCFYAWALVLPMLFHPVLAVLACYLLASMACGVTLSVVFQLAHCVEGASFPEAAAGARLEREFSAHQVETTVDFARGSRFWTWFTGGLNFQIEHHLFPRVCHLRYPALSEIVEEVSGEYGVRYVAHPSFGSAVKSHYRWLRQMGQATAA